MLIIKPDRNNMEEDSDKSVKDEGELLFAEQDEGEWQ